MANFYPSEIGGIEHDSSNRNELDTLVDLKNSLSDHYSVYHSVHWSKANTRTTSFGEIDFVIVNGAGSILVIEQKNGVVEETEAGLLKAYGLNRKLIDSQIQRNIGNLRDKYKSQHPGRPGLKIDYIIYCPDYRVVNINGAGIDMSRTIDANSKGDLGKRIDQLLGEGGEQDAPLVNELHHFLISSFRIAPDVSSYKSSGRKVYKRLLAGLTEVIENLDFQPFRLRVIGTAGSGKTQVSLSFCEKYLEGNGAPLLLCFNRALADKYNELALEGVTVNTYNGFVRNVAESLGVDIDFENAGEEGFWQNLEESLLALDLDGAQKYDCLVIDEGQDFHQGWYEIIQLFLSDGATHLWLEDPLQNLRDQESVSLPGFVTYTDNSNFRTPTTIAEFVKGVLGVEFEQKNQLPGLGAEVYQYEDILELKRILQDRVYELIKVGFEVGDIAIISCRGMGSTALAGINNVGKHGVRRFTGSYNSSNEQVYTDGPLIFDTIYRYKGQQAPVVILVDLDDSLKRNERSIRMLYCAMTRATVRLELVARKDCPWLEEFRDNV